jgi:hypothetical protein
VVLNGLIVIIRVYCVLWFNRQIGLYHRPAFPFNQNVIGTSKNGPGGCAGLAGLDSAGVLWRGGFHLRNRRRTRQLVREVLDREPPIV